MNESLFSYLLGKLPEAERDALEEQCFTDHERYYRLCEIEQALIDDYVRGYLSAADRACFERHFLTLPARIERVKTARTLIEKIDNSEQPDQPEESSQLVSWLESLRGWLRAPQLAWALAAAMLLLTIGGWLLLRESNRLRMELANAENNRNQWQQRAQTYEQQIADERTTNRRLNETIESLRNGTPTAPMKSIVFALAAGVLRSEEGQTLPTLKLARDSAAGQVVQLQMTFTGTLYPRYEAVLQTAEGGIVKKWLGRKAAKLGSEQSRLTFAIPSSQLASADYVLILNGKPTPQSTGEEITRSAFRVVR